MMDLQNLVLLQVGNGLIQKMPENMTRQLRDAGGVEVEVESRRPEDEAELFFTAMKQMEEVVPNSPSASASPKIANS
ncbi:unnamed protein product [Symbiodinium sp. CCMP2592]|nr:unnamed protein product [Symbiodinium sp. CCMP2592]